MCSKRANSSLGSRLCGASLVMSMTLWAAPAIPAQDAGKPGEAGAPSSLIEVSSKDRVGRANVFMFTMPVEENEILRHIRADAVWGENCELPGCAGALAASVTRNHRRGISHFTNISAFEPLVPSLDARPELNQAACLDIDLNPIMYEAGFGIFLPLMDTLEPLWQQFIRDQVIRAVDAGSDGVIIDEIQGTSLNPGCFNQADMAGFRQFLKLMYSPSELASRFGIADIDSYDYGQYIRSANQASTWKSQWWAVPLASEFYQFQILAIQKFWSDLIGESKDYAWQKQGRDFLFSGNVSALEQFSIMFADSLDFYTLEFPYFNFIGFPPAGKAIPAAKLSRAFGNKKPVFLLQVGTSGELVRRGNVHNLAKIYIAESYAAQGEFMIPHEIFSGGPQSYSAELPVVAPYYDFIQEHRFLYEQTGLMNPRVGLIYSFPSNFFAHYAFLNSFYGAGYALLDSQIQHDVIFCGDDFMLEDSSTLEQFAGYEVLILPNARNLSDFQVRGILDYVFSGGTVIAWGATGTADERNLVPDPGARSQLTALATPGSHFFGAGTFTYLPGDPGGGYFDSRTTSVRDSISGEVFRWIPRQVEVNAPNHVDVLAYAGESQDLLVFHVINYNYDIDTDAVDPVETMDLKFLLPPGYDMQGKQVYLLSPDRNSPRLLPHSHGNGAVLSQIAGLQFYDVVLVIPEAAASSLAEAEISNAALARAEAEFLGHDTSSVEPMLGEIQSALSSYNYFEARRIGRDIRATLSEITRPVVLFDETHNERNTLSPQRAALLNPDNPEFHLYGELGADFEGDLELNSLMPGSALTESLDGVDVLVLAAPSDPFFGGQEKIFSQVEIDRVVGFVRNGGALLFLGDCCLFDPAPDSSSVNTLLAHFGIQFIPGALRSLSAPDPGESYIFAVEDFEPHVLTTNLRAVQVIGPGHLTVSGEARALAHTRSDTFRDLDGDGVKSNDEAAGPFVFMAAAEYGRGRVVVLADNDFTDAIYHHQQDQRALMRNILLWLTERDELFLNSFASGADRFTGIAFTNRGEFDSAVLLKAFGHDGLLLEGPDIVNPATLRIPAGTQTAQLAWQILGSGLSGRSGWIEVLKEDPGIVGFSLLGDTGLTFLDGSDFQKQRSALWVFPEVFGRDGGFARIFLSNPSDDMSALVRIELHDGLGNRLGSLSTRITPNGALEFFPAELFGPQASNKGFVTVSSDIEITGFELFGDGGALGALNGMPRDDRQPRRFLSYSAQLASGQSYFTELNIINPSGQVATLAISAHDGSGAVIGQIPAVLTPGEQLKGRASALFDFSAALANGELVTGWIKLESDNPEIVACVTFGDPNGRFLASLPLETRASRNVVFSHVAQGGGYWTGLAVLNPNPVSAAVTIEVFDAAGNLTAQGDLELAPGERAARLLNQLVTGLENQTGGFIRVKSSIGIIAFELFGTDRLEVLSAIPPQ